MNYNFAGCDVVKIANEFETPLYVYDEDLIIKNIKELKKSFDYKYKNACTYYASKAFLTKDIVRILIEEEIGIDVVSGGELYIAKKLNFPPNKIMFHGNSKSLKEIEEGILYNVGYFVSDSIDEIVEIDKIAKKYNKIQKVLIRITPGIDPHTHKYINTASDDSKFGIPIPFMLEAIKAVNKLKNIEIDGLHFHIGSQLFENKCYMMATENLLKLIYNLNKETGFVPKVINFGGGFGVKYTEKDSPMPPSYFIDPIISMTEKFVKENNFEMPTIFIEPGRWIVGEAGITLYTVNNVKETNGFGTYVAIDGGMNDNIRTSLYEAEYEAIVANKFEEKSTKTITIAGKCCESGDIIARDIKTPDVCKGDIILIKTTGAYHYSMANNYNKNPIPAIVFIKNGIPRISVKRQTYEDLYRNEI